MDLESGSGTGGLCVEAEVVEGLHKQIAVLEQQVFEASQRNAETESASKDLCTENNILKSNIAELEKEYEERLRILHETNAQRDELVNRKNAAETEVISISNKAAFYKGQVERVTMEKRYIVDELDSIKKALNESIAVKCKLQLELDHFQQDKRSMEYEKERWKTEKELYLQSKSWYSQEVISRDSTIAKLRIEMGSLEAKLEHEKSLLFEQWDEAVTDAESSKEKIEILTKQLDEACEKMREALAERDSSLCDFDLEIQAKNRIISTLKEQEEGFLDENNHLRDEVARRTSVIDKCKAAVLESREQIRTQKEQSDQERRNMQRLEAENKVLRSSEYLHEKLATTLTEMENRLKFVDEDSKLRTTTHFEALTVDRDQLKTLLDRDLEHLRDKLQFTQKDLEDVMANARSDEAQKNQKMVEHYEGRLRDCDEQMRLMKLNVEQLHEQVISYKKLAEQAASRLPDRSEDHEHVNKELLEENSKLKSACVTLRERFDIYREERLKADRVYEQRIDQQIQLINELRTIRAKLESEHNVTLTYSKAAHKQVADSDRELLKLREKLEKIAVDKKVAEQKTEHATQLLFTAQEDVAKLRSKANCLQNQSDQERRNMQRLETEIKVLRALTVDRDQLKTLLSQINDELKRSTMDRDLERKKFEHEVEILQIAKKKAEQELSILQSENISVKSKVTTLEKQFNSLESMDSGDPKASQQVINRNDYLETQVRELEEKLDDAQIKIEAKEKELETLQGLTLSIESSIKDQDQFSIIERNQLQSQLDGSQAALSESRDIITRLRNDMSSLEAKLADQEEAYVALYEKRCSWPQMDDPDVVSMEIDDYNGFIDEEGLEVADEPRADANLPDDELGEDFEQESVDCLEDYDEEVEAEDDPEMQYLLLDLLLESSDDEEQFGRPDDVVVERAASGTHSNQEPDDDNPEDPTSSPSRA